MYFGFDSIENVNFSHLKKNTGIKFVKFIIIHNTTKGIGFMKKF